MRLKKTFVAEMEREADRRLLVLGYVRHSRGIYVESIAKSAFPGVAGWLGLNSALYVEEITVNPVVGVQHEQLERLLIELAEETYGAGLPPTISSPLGYLKPEKRHEIWHFPLGESPGSSVDSMVDAFTEFGVPFINGHRNLAAITEFLESAKTMTPWKVATRLPLALLLAGRADAGEGVITREEARLGDRRDEAAKQYRFFVQRYRQRFGTAQSPVSR